MSLGCPARLHLSGVKYRGLWEGVFVIRQAEFGEATFAAVFLHDNITCRENDLLGPNKCTEQSKANLPRCHQRPHDVLSSFPRHLIPFKGMRTREPVRRAVSPKHTLTSEEPKMSIGKNKEYSKPLCLMPHSPNPRLGYCCTPKESFLMIRLQPEKMFGSHPLWLNASQDLEPLHKGNTWFSLHYYHYSVKASERL